MKELVEIQKELKAPKNQRNTFGKYNYRSCEDILEAVKPLANELGCSVMLSDTVKEIGGRVYVEATARLVKGGEGIQCTALAREPLSQKGMNEAQITGSASSYARKYALNGLFAIDDTKDVDTDELHKNTDGNKPATKVKVKLNETQLVSILTSLESGNIKHTKEKIISSYNLDKDQIERINKVKVKAKAKAPVKEEAKPEALAPVKKETPAKEEVPAKEEPKTTIPAKKIKCLQARLDEICLAIFRGTAKTTPQAVLDFYDLTDEQIKQVNNLKK